jgi:hypothetical protein
MTTMTQQEFIQKLKLLTDEIAIQKLTIKYFDQNLVNATKRELTALRTAIIETFPNKTESTPGYYFTNQGKGLGERYEHLSLWYLNTNTQLRCLCSDELRQDYFNFLSGFTEFNDATNKAKADYLQKLNDLSEIKFDELRKIGNASYGIKNCGLLTKSELIYKILCSKPVTDIKPEPTKPEPTKPVTDIKPVTQPTQQLTLETMNIESLNLDADTKKNVIAALEHSGMTLPEFIQKACTIYAKTLTGKAKQFKVNLAEISTQDLIIKPELRTLPGRAEELIKRAIRAIHKYNSDCVSSDDERWLISLTSIQSLTGCNTKKLAELAPKFETAIADANASFPNVTAYTNKYRRIKGANISQYVDMVGLIPNGIE